MYNKIKLNCSIFLILMLIQAAVSFPAKPDLPNDNAKKDIVLTQKNPGGTENKLKDVLPEADAVISHKNPVKSNKVSKNVWGQLPKYEFIIAKSKKDEVPLNTNSIDITKVSKILAEINKEVSALSYNRQLTNVNSKNGYPVAETTDEFINLLSGSSKQKSSNDKDDVHKKKLEELFAELSRLVAGDVKPKSDDVLTNTAN